MYVYAYKHLLTFNRKSSLIEACLDTLSDSVTTGSSFLTHISIIANTLYMSNHFCRHNYRLNLLIATKFNIASTSAISKSLTYCSLCFPNFTSRFFVPYRIKTNIARLFFYMVSQYAFQIVVESQSPSSYLY